MARKKVAVVDAYVEVVAAPKAPDTPEVAVKKAGLLRQLYALAGKPEKADEFEKVRLEMHNLS